MNHVYGIDIGNSFSFQDQIRYIADAISKKKAVRRYFGNSPFVTPNKDLFALRKDDNNQIIVTTTPGPESKINITVRHEYTTKDDYNNITALTKECCELICNRLEVEIIRIGTIFEIVSNVSDKFAIFNSNFSNEILPDRYKPFGGYVKHIYTILPEQIGKELNVNLEIDVNTTEEKIITKVDINNKDVFMGMTQEEIIKLGDYSLLFIQTELNDIFKRRVYH
ncbi:hypothetical protein MGI18_23155 [Bacillus sp. OVS6]|nr:hypothetical protein MGI18_23155 [Bacillus sp. OVS6]